MLISTIISSINSAGTVIIIIIISVIITVIINSIGIVTKKTIRILIVVIKVVDFPVMSAPSAEFKDRTRLFLKQETFSNVRTAVCVALIVNSRNITSDFVREPWTLRYV